MAEKKKVVLSGNFKKEMLRREKPECYGRHKTVSEQKPKKCGMCWFAHNCKGNKSLPKSEGTKKVETKQQDLIK